MRGGRGAGTDLIEKTQDNDPTRAPQLEGLKPRLERPPPLHYHHHPGSELPSLETRAERGAVVPTHHTGSLWLPLHRHPSLRWQAQGKRSCRPVQGRKLTPSSLRVTTHPPNSAPSLAAGRWCLHRPPAAGSSLSAHLQARFPDAQECQSGKKNASPCRPAATRPREASTCQEERLCSQNARAPAPVGQLTVRGER